MKMIMGFKIVIMVVLCLAVGGVSGYVSGSSGVGDWYPSLVKPYITPPSWLFGVVWPILYILMGVAAGLIWAKGLSNKSVRLALGLFLIQLIFNGFWSPLFFGLHRIDWALLEIIVLWIAIAVTEAAFWKIHPAAAILLWPYLVWVSFAVALNSLFWKLN
jgi:tryptophan-rich sensory protein